MAQTSREIVRRCVRFEHPARIPRELWTLPWAEEHFPDALRKIRARFPGDFGGPSDVFRPSPRRRGNAYEIGTFVDEWGCAFTQVQRGVIGEVRAPLIAEIADWRSVRPPYETLPDNPAAARDRVNRDCADSTLFMRAGCARPWERYQFLRGSQNAMVDVMEPDAGAAELLRVIHEFYLKEMEFWAGTDVDALLFMDDWGAQSQLLIPPPVWRELFKPLYKDYCDLAHSRGKLIFMHSDGHIAEIYDDLIEIGVDAINSQLFCMDMADLARRAKGRITFWGEIDRQHVLPSADPQKGREAVRLVARHFYNPAGGVIAQFELGAGANPETALAIFDEWAAVDAAARRADASYSSSFWPFWG
jgi:hypothetical protein